VGASKPRKKPAKGRRRGLVKVQPKSAIRRAGRSAAVGHKK
jgi:hypothetical protein